MAKDATKLIVSGSTVGVRELNSRLSEYLGAVREGAEVTITSHGRAIARLLPATAPDPLDRLREQGLLIEPTGPELDIDEWEPIPVEGSVSDLVSEQRR